MKAGPSISIGQHSEAGRKERNDDSYGVVVPDAALLEAKGIAMAIADGMSSSEAAKIASETCVKTFLEDYYATHPPGRSKPLSGACSQPSIAGCTAKARPTICRIEAWSPLSRGSC